MSVTLEERLNAYGPVLDRAMADDLIERAADLSSERARPRRSSRQLIVAMVVVALACIAAVGVALTGGHSSNSTTATTTTVVTPTGEHASQAAANAALLPLADLPAGTLSQTPAKPSNVSCTSTPLVKKPRFFAIATYRLPRSTTRLNDGVNIYAPGGAAQIMRNVREQWNCPVATDPNHPDERWSVATLNFPSIAPGQLSYRISAQLCSAPRCHDHDHGRRTNPARELEQRLGVDRRIDVGLDTVAEPVRCLTHRTRRIGPIGLRGLCTEGVDSRRVDAWPDPALQRGRRGPYAEMSCVSGGPDQLTRPLA